MIAVSTRLRLGAVVMLTCVAASCNTNSYIQTSVAMEPTIKVGQRIVVSTSAYQRAIPARWDIVLFRFPESGDPVVMRIVGLPGEAIDIRDDGILLDGNPVRIPAFLSKIQYRRIVAQAPVQEVAYPLRIPQGSYFVLGDNPSHSRDSRFWGVLSAGDIIGKVILDQD